MRSVVWLALLVLAPWVSALAQRPTTAPNFHARFVALAGQRGLSDSARLHALFALDWEYTNIESPETASFVGFPGQDERWTDRSVPALQRRRREIPDRALVLRAIDRRKLNPVDRLSYDIFARGVEESVRGLRFPAELMAVTQLQGPQYLSDVMARMPATSVREYERILARLAGIPGVIAQVRVLLDSGVARGITPPRVTLSRIPGQIDGLVPEEATASALLAPFTRIPTSIPEADRVRLLSSAVRVYREQVRPAYQGLNRYLVDSYIPRARETIARSSLPDGKAWYAYDVALQTTTSRSATEIHQLGLSEVQRIRAQMDSTMRATGFTGDRTAFVSMLRSDPRFFFTDSASLVRRYRDIAKRIDPELARQFGRLPRLPYGIAAIPSFSAPSQPTAYYEAGSPDAFRPGLFRVNTHNLASRPMWEMEALTAHEGVPGHHLQIALSQELGDLPPFRRYAGYTAFVEGWALYAESLGGSLGLYEDPYSRYGQLTYEVWRAIRLVLDTGIHEMGWSREQAIQYFRANSAKSEQEIITEVDRYIVWPGQALAYKSGELAIKALRSRAERELGDAFDIRAFHDEVLSQGAIPLDLLDHRIGAWIESRKAIPSGKKATSR